jgi:hypothetical protein
LIAQFTGLTFEQIGALEYVKYLTYRRDAFINALNQTEEGRKYLDDAWRMEQTAPDIGALRDRFGKGEKMNGK